MAHTEYSQDNLPAPAALQPFTLESSVAMMGAATLKRDEVPVAEWNGVVTLQELTGTDRDALEVSMVQQRGGNAVQDLRNMRAKLLVRSIIDPTTGKRIFKDEDDVKLGAQPATVLIPLFDRASRLSGLTKKDVDELVGNSDGAPSAAS